MSTVQANLLKFALRADPIAKGTSTTVAGQKFKATADGIAVASVATDGGVVKVTATNHGLSNNTYVTIYGASGTYAGSINNTASNPAWIINDVATDSFNLIGSTYTGAVTTGTIVPTMVGSASGTRFTRQRLLDIYNEARMVLFNALSETKSPSELGKLIAGIFTSATATIAAYSAPYRAIAKPTGFLKLINIVDGAATPLRIDILPTSLLEDVRTSVTSTYTASATNLLAFEIGANWCIYGNYGTTPASIDYYGITAWTWITDIFPNTTNESFRPDLEPILIEIACAIADEQSGTSPLELAKTLLNQKG